MPEHRLAVEECPLDACDLPPDRAVKTTRGTKLTAHNQSHERVCITPSTMETDNGLRPAFIITYHNDLEPPDAEFTTASDLDRDFTTVERRVLRVLERKTEAEAAVVAGALADAAHPPSDVEDALESLADADVIEEANGTYQTY